MASAGRILIMPKGDYNASTTYERLDLVYHNGASWIAKKTVVGIEPTNTSEEHWQQMSDFKLLDERKQERKVKIVTLPANSNYVLEFSEYECCMLCAYVGKKMAYTCIFACSGINEWSYRITKLNETIFNAAYSSVVGGEAGVDLNTITFKNTTDEDIELTLIKIPFNYL